MSSFTPMFKPTAARPFSQYQLAKKHAGIMAALRDHLKLSSWLLIGGVLQGFFMIFLGPKALVPGTLILLYRTIDHLLMASGVTRNRYMDDVLVTKFGSQPPQSDGKFGSTPAEKSVVVFLLGGKCNHPLGALSPGMLEMEKRFTAVQAALEAEPEKNGFLGMSGWHGDGQDSAMSEVLYVVYLRDIDSLHRFAHSATHLSSMKHWTELVKKHSHIGISHEVFVVPEGQWSNIYINMRPTGMSATHFPITTNKTEEAGLDLEGKIQRASLSEKQWLCSAVDSRNGPLRTMARRMGREDLQVHEKLNGTMWDRSYNQELADSVNSKAA